MLGAFTIDVVSDVVCPWCYIGKRRLEAALAQLREADPELPVAVRWHPFQLNPDVPSGGIGRTASTSRRSSAGRSGARQVYARVGAAGETVGIPFAFDAIERQPNTLDAHRLIAWAQSRTEGDARRAGRDAVPRLLRRRPLRRRSRGARDGSRDRRATTPTTRAHSSTRTR